MVHEGKMPASHTENTMSDQQSPIAPKTPRRGRRILTVATIALAAGLTGAATSRAISQGGWQGPGFMAGMFDPASIEDRADRAVRHLAIEIDATAEQQDKLRGIVKGAVKDLLPMREKSLAARQRGRVILTQPSIDRAAIEALRVEQMALADAASKRFAQALGDAADVLTPDQRRKIDQRITEVRQRWGFWHGWRRG
jgi:Spy/CpxP family protein refolding chaperone